MKPTCTAIVPTCARPALLRRALESIARQSRPPEEVLVVDDGPPDGVPSTRAAALSVALPGLRVLRNRGAKGAAGARNAGASAAGGEVLLFLDDDDEWLPSYVEVMLEQFDEPAAELACAGFVVPGPWGFDMPEKRAPRVLRPAEFLVRNPGLRGSNLAIRRSLFERIGGFDETLPAMNDRDLGYRLATVTKGYRPVSRRLVRFHAHDGPRLSSPGSPANRRGVERFYERYRSVMQPRDRRRFAWNIRRFWKLDESAREAPASPELRERLYHAWTDLFRVLERRDLPVYLVRALRAALTRPQQRTGVAAARSPVSTGR